MLGKICRLTNRHTVAQSYHKAALTLDPLLWSAYEELCMLGESRSCHEGLWGTNLGNVLLMLWS